jgi:hypothetical protein
MKSTKRQKAAEGTNYKANFLFVHKKSTLYSKVMMSPHLPTTASRGIQEKEADGLARVQGGRG